MNKVAIVALTVLVLVLVASEAQADPFSDFFEWLGGLDWGGWGRHRRPDWCTDPGWWRFFEETPRECL